MSMDILASPRFCSLVLALTPARDKSPMPSLNRIATVKSTCVYQLLAEKAQLGENNRGSVSTRN